MMNPEPHVLAIRPDAEPLAPVSLERQRLLISQWLTWLDEQVALQQLSELTRDGYRSKIRYWVDFLEQHARTDQPTPGTVQDYIRAQITSDHEPATTNAYLNTVKSFYRWCESSDRYPAIARSIRTLREFRDGPLPALTHDQVVALIGGIPEDTLGLVRDRALLSLLYATALRTISLVRADIEDLDLGRCTLAHQGKGHLGKDATAIIPRSVADLIRRYLTRRQAEVGIPLTPRPQPLFIALDRRSKGQRLTAKTIRRQVLAYMECAGHAVRRDGVLINPGLFSAHSLRRSAAVTTADAVGVEVAQGLLGHASVETTKQAYARVSLERQLRENAQRLDPLSVPHRQP
jgi:integrase/recombinase XerC